jgi:hypothetical protein
MLEKGAQRVPADYRAMEGMIFGGTSEFDEIVGDRSRNPDQHSSESEVVAAQSAIDP